MIINKFHFNVNRDEIHICDELMFDMVQRAKDELMKKELKYILKNMFRKFDIDGSGTISYDELEKSAKERTGGTLCSPLLLQTLDGRDSLQRAGR